VDGRHNKAGHDGMDGDGIDIDGMDVARRSITIACARSTIT
jgi:hypothetical protein